MIRAQKKLVASVVLAFVAWQFMALEDTEVLLHAFSFLAFIIGLTYSLHRLLEYVVILTTPFPLPKKDGPKDLQKPGQPRYSKTFLVLALLLAGSALRLSLPPGIPKLLVSSVCFSCVVLIYLENISPAVTSLVFIAAWWILCYKWILYEICRFNADVPSSYCYIGWTYNPLILIALFIRPWVHRYGQKWKEYVFKAVVFFPYIFAFFFLCSWWCLVSVNTFWMQKSVYTKAEVMKYVPANYSLGATVISTPDDVSLIPVESYPVFFKPNQCTGEARGISPIDTKEQALEYLRIRNNEKPEKTTLMQTFHHGGGEATIIYYRYPYFNHGSIKTSWLKLARLEFNWDAEMRRRVQQVYQGPDYWFLTRMRVPTEIRFDFAEAPALVKALDDIAHAVPGITVCRFDVKYESIEELKAGIFKVIELDMPPFGDRSEKQRASDYAANLPNWLLSVRQARTVLLWFYIGFVNIVMGNTPGPITMMTELPKLINIAHMCSYHGSMAPVTPGIQ